MDMRIINKLKRFLAVTLKKMCRNETIIVVKSLID